MYISGVDEIKGLETIEETLEYYENLLTSGSTAEESIAKTQIRKLNKLYNKKIKETFKKVEVLDLKKKGAGTQKGEIKRHLKDEGSVTSWDAFKEYGITRLSHIIYMLRREGWVIKTTDITKTNRYGNLVTFAKYSINENETK